MALEYSPDGEIWFDTAFYGNSSMIGNWMTENGSRRRISANPDGDSASVSPGNRLSVTNIQQYLENVNTRFSFAGRNAANADSESLALAERMEREGADAEGIRRETGWFRGMEGMWRFEIDDSGMGYDKDYERYLELADMADNGTIVMMPSEEREYYRLKKRFLGAPGTIPEGYVHRLDLQDYIDHPALFENYPQLRDFGLVFTPLVSGASLDLNNDVILLPEKYRGAPQRSLVHEIQHAIQKLEGFSPGATDEYWDKRKDVEGGEPRTADENMIGLTMGEPEKILRSLPPDVADRFREFAEHDKKHEYYQAGVLYDKFKESEYRDELYAFHDALREGETLYPGRIRSSNELYMHTAGEIEARDSARRRGMGADERRASPPDLGDDRNVFSDIMARIGAEDSGGYRPEFDDSAISENRQKFAEMGSVSDISGHELDGDAPLKDRVLQYFRENTLYNPALGEISFTDSSFRDDRGHGFTRGKVAAFAAVPDVVYSGEIISYRKDYPGRGADRIVVAAPISIDGETYYAGVELIRGSAGQRFYLHDVITEKKASMTFTTRPAFASEGTESRATDNLFHTDIIHQAFQDGKAKNANTRFSLDGAQLTN